MQSILQVCCALISQPTTVPTVVGTILHHVHGSQLWTAWLENSLPPSGRGCGHLEAPIFSWVRT